MFWEKTTKWKFLSFSYSEKERKKVSHKGKHRHTSIKGLNRKNGKVERERENRWKGGREEEWKGERMRRKKKRRL